MDKIRKDRHQSQTSYDMTTSRATSRVNSRVNKLRYSWYSYYDFENCSFGCLLGMQKIFAEPWISLVGFMQTFLGSKGFSKLWTNRELRVSVFFLRFSLRISLHLVEAFYYCHLSFLCFRFAALRSDHILLADLQTIPSNQSIRTASSQTTPDQIRPQMRPQLTIVRPDHHQIRLSEQTFTATPDYQIRSPHQTTDHRPPSLTTQLPISTEYLTSWTGTGQVHSLWVGSRGVYKALDEPCKAYFPHTFGLKTPEFFFRLNLIVVRLVSGFPGLVRVSPSLFHKLGSFAGVRSATRVRLLGIGSVFVFGLASWKRFGCIFLRLFQMDFATATFVVVVVVFTTTSRLVAPNLNWSITLHLIVYALVKWSFHPQGSTRQWLF